MSGMMDNAKKMGKKAQDEGLDKKGKNMAKNKLDKKDQQGNQQNSQQ